MSKLLKAAIFFSKLIKRNSKKKTDVELFLEAKKGLDLKVKEVLMIGCVEEALELLNLAPKSYTISFIHYYNKKQFNQCCQVLDSARDCLNTKNIKTLNNTCFFGIEESFKIS